MLKAGSIDTTDTDTYYMQIRTFVALKAGCDISTKRSLTYWATDLTQNSAFVNYDKGTERSNYDLRLGAMLYDLGTVKVIRYKVVMVYCRIVLNQV